MKLRQYLASLAIAASLASCSTTASTISNTTPTTSEKPKEVKPRKKEVKSPKKQPKLVDINTCWSPYRGGSDNLCIRNLNGFIEKYDKATGNRSCSFRKKCLKDGKVSPNEYFGPIENRFIFYDINRDYYIGLEDDINKDNKITLEDKIKQDKAGDQKKRQSNLGGYEK